MMSAKRKLLATILVIVLALAVFGAWIWRGNPSDRTTDATSGKTPLLVEAESERIPSVSLPRTVGWQPGEAPAAASGARC